MDILDKLQKGSPPQAITWVKTDMTPNLQLVFQKRKKNSHTSSGNYRPDGALQSVPRTLMKLSNNFFGLCSSGAYYFSTSNTTPLYSPHHLHKHQL